MTGSPDIYLEMFTVLLLLVSYFNLTNSMAKYQKTSELSIKNCSSSKNISILFIKMGESDADLSTYT